MEEAERAVEEELDKLKKDGIDDKELVKVKNRTEAVIAFEDMSLTNRAQRMLFVWRQFNLQVNGIHYFGSIGSVDHCVLSVHPC